MSFNIEEYLQELDVDIEEIVLNCKCLEYIPDLSRFKNLKKLNCEGNKLKSLPKLPESLEILDCYCNKLTIIEELPENLKKRYKYLEHQFNNEVQHLRNLASRRDKMSGLCQNHTNT